MAKAIIKAYVGRLFYLKKHKYMGTSGGSYRGLGLYRDNFPEVVFVLDEDNKNVQVLDINQQPRWIKRFYLAKEAIPSNLFGSSDTLVEAIVFLSAIRETLEDKQEIDKCNKIIQSLRQLADKLLQDKLNNVGKAEKEVAQEDGLSTTEVVQKDRLSAE